MIKFLSKCVLATAVASLVLAGSAMTADAAAKKKARAKAASTAASEQARTAGFQAIPVSGCVREVPVFLGTCKFIKVGDVNYSAAVLSEVPFVSGALRGLPSAQPILANTNIIGSIVTLGGPSIKCALAGIPGGVRGSIVIQWTRAVGTCPTP